MEMSSDARILAATLQEKRVADARVENAISDARSCEGNFLKVIQSLWERNGHKRIRLVVTTADLGSFVVTVYGEEDRLMRYDVEPVILP